MNASDEKTEAIDSLMGEIESIYLRRSWTREWAHEASGIRETLVALSKQLEGTFRFQDILGVGGTGITIRMRDERLGMLGEDVVFSVIKIPRPYFEAVIEHETERLIGLRHDNLIRIQVAGSVHTDRQVPFFLMEAIDGAFDSDEWIERNPRVEEVVRVLEGALNGLGRLHRSAIAHLDLKPENIFVSPEAVIVADLGFAKRVEGSGDTSKIGRTPWYTHPDYEALIATAVRSPRPAIARSDLRVEWDIYSLGVTLLVMLRILEDAKVDPTEYTFRYLKLMAYRMLGAEAKEAFGLTRNITFGGHATRLSPPLVEDKYLGLNPAAFALLAYTSVHEIIDDIRKLTGRRDLLRNVPEILEFPREVIQAASHGAAPFSGRVAALLAVPEVRQLAKVDQLGLVRLVYPTATHSRLEHSLGTLAMAARFTRALYNDPVSPLFKQFMNEADIEVLLVVCLLHDIGHYPLAHDLEEVDDLFKHEARTLRLLRSKGIREALGGSDWADGIADRVVSVLRDHEASDRPVQDMLIRAVIDGPVDADKLDYLIRDSENLRLPYGRGVDVNKLLQSLTVIVKSGTKEDDREKIYARIGINDKGRIAAESVAFARYSLYGSVYWHRTHRTLKAMLNRLSYEALSAHRASLSATARKRSASAVQAELNKFLDLEQSRPRPLTPQDRLADVDDGRYFDSRTEQIVAWLVGLVRRRPTDGDRRSVLTQSFEALAADILSRRLYSRICVVTRSRGDWPAPVWKQVDSIFGQPGRNWKRRLEFTLSLQREMANVVTKYVDDNSPTDVADLLTFVEGAAAGKPVLLVDFPPHKPGSARPLEYRREDRSKAGERDPFDVTNVESSSVWNQVSNAYRESLGKLRVYCHPAYASLIARHFTNKQLQEIVLGVLTRTDEAPYDDDADDDAG